LFRDVGSGSVDLFVQHANVRTCGVDVRSSVGIVIRSNVWFKIRFRSEIRFADARRRLG
jgi:hypothetical protein